MAVATQVRNGVRTRPIVVTAVLSVLGYALVIGTFLGLFDWAYPSLTETQADLLAGAIAVVNTAALLSLIAGVYYIKNRAIEKHRLAMLTAFGLILVFLVIYMLRVGGFGEKEIIAPTLVTVIYQIMLAIHILLSIVSVPVVIYVVLMGLTHTAQELTQTPKAKIGRIAAVAWILSLFLGVVTYILLNHAYDNQIREALFLLALAPMNSLTGRIHGRFHAWFGRQYRALRPTLSRASVSETDRR